MPLLLLLIFFKSGVESSSSEGLSQSQNENAVKTAGGEEGEYYEDVHGDGRETVMPSGPRSAPVATKEHFPQSGFTQKKQLSPEQVLL